MRCFKIIGILVLFLNISYATQANEVDKLLEKASHSSTPEEKKNLLKN